VRVADITLPTSEANLALDEALLLMAEAGRGGEVLRFWELSQYAVMLGAGGRLAEDVDEGACWADEIPILRRASGGGTVVLGPGCLCFSLILAYESDPALRDIHASYRFILERSAAALKPLLPGTSPAGTSDLAAHSRKFSGNSQQRKRNFLLHHGTILYDFDLPRVARYLRQPARQPKYRENREHDAFLRNFPASAADLKRALKAAWKADEVMTKVPHEQVQYLVEEKYARPEWIRRR
jgi:lipoate-protein ligase A